MNRMSESISMTLQLVLFFSVIQFSKPKCKECGRTKNDKIHKYLFFFHDDSKKELVSNLLSLSVNHVIDLQKASNKFLNDPQKHKEHVEQT